MEELSHPSSLWSEYFQQIDLLNNIQQQHNHDLNASFVAQHAYDDLPVDSRHKLEYKRVNDNLLPISVIFRHPIHDRATEPAHTIYGVCFLLRQNGILIPSYAEIVDECHGSTFPVGNHTASDIGLVFGLAKEIEGVVNLGRLPDLSLNYTRIEKPYGLMNPTRSSRA